MEYKDYYKTLGVGKGATPKEIKAAFRRLAREHHPDMNAGDARAEARFKEIGEAYEVLSDPAKRRRYDRLGPLWGSFGKRPRGPRAPVDFGGDLSGFSEFFKTIFGGVGVGETGRPVDFAEVLRRNRRAGGSVATSASDVEVSVDLTLEEVLRGTTRTVTAGDGSGRRVEVKIPPGTRDGSRVRVGGEGARGPTGRRGDLYLRVRVRPHPHLEKKDDDLQTTVAVPLTTAVLGGETSVPTLEGPVGIKVPAGSRPGLTLRLRGRGLPRLESPSQRGDLLAVLAVELPQDLTPREIELFRELRKLGR